MMKSKTKKRCQQGILTGGIVLFSLLTTQSANGISPARPMSRRAPDAAVLLQHNDMLSTLKQNAFKLTVATSSSINLPENVNAWGAVAMNGRRVLFFYEPDSTMAICTLDENGASVEWLPLDYSLRGFIPVALENNRILIQCGPYGALAKVEFDDEGCFVSKKLLSENSQGWAARGMDTNRIVLEHVRTGDVAIWAANPKAPLFRPYLSFILSPGWTVQDFAEDFVLIQQGETGAVTLVELGNDYRAKEHTEPVSGDKGWRAVALAQ